MKKLKADLLPWITVAVSILGFFLSFWFYRDGMGLKNLLRPGHIASVLLIIVSVLAVVSLFLLSRKLPKMVAFNEFLPAKLIRSIGCLIGAVGFAYTCITGASTADTLSLLALVMSIVGAICLLFVGTQRLFGMDPHYLFYGLITLFFMVLGLHRCRLWGSETQILVYLFSLVSQIFLLMTSYHYTALSYGLPAVRGFCFYCGCAVFFCLVAFASEFDFLYLSCAIWLLLDGCFFKIPNKE